MKPVYTEPWYSHCLVKTGFTVLYYDYEGFILHFRGKINKETVTRQYTPVSDVICTGHFDLLIKVNKSSRYTDCIFYDLYSIFHTF